MTTTDDLRTRARRAAARVYPFDGTDPNAVIALRSAYVHGFLAAYEQLPGWEEIAREVAYWAPTWDDAGSIADVVLALIHGAES